MKDIAYTNDGTTPKYVGPYLLQPGDTRMVSAADLPPEAIAKEAPPAAPVDAVLALLDGSVAEIKSRLYDYADADLDRLEAAENAGKTRKGVQAAIAEERLNRASAVGDVAEVIERIGEAPDELLTGFDSVENPHRFNRPLRAAVDAELLKRGLQSTEGAGA